jgi:gentisate 1,2-dioxygenase
MLPVNHAARARTSPVFSYPYARTREALETLRRSGPCDPHDGVKLQYVNPATGGFAMPTMATFMQLLPAGFAGEPFRATDGTVYIVVEGACRAQVGGQRFELEPRDVFVAPSWTTTSLAADADAVLFSFSDRPVQQALGLWREERLGAP